MKDHQSFLRAEARLAEAGALPTAARRLDAAADEMERLENRCDEQYKKRREECTRFAAIAGVEDSRDTRIVLADATVAVERLQAIVDKLPKCWRLNDAGELVQDCPVVPGMKVWVWERRLYPTIYRFNVESVSAANVIFASCRSALSRYTYNSLEAAEKAKEK